MITLFDNDIFHDFGNIISALLGTSRVNSAFEDDYVVLIDNLKKGEKCIFRTDSAAGKEAFNKAVSSGMGYSCIFARTYNEALAIALDKCKLIIDNLNKRIKDQQSLIKKRTSQLSEAISKMETSIATTLSEFDLKYNKKKFEAMRVFNAFKEMFGDTINEEYEKTILTKINSYKLSEEDAKLKEKVAAALREKLRMFQEGCETTIKNDTEELKKMQSVLAKVTISYEHLKGKKESASRPNTTQPTAEAPEKSFKFEF